MLSHACRIDGQRGVAPAPVDISHIHAKRRPARDTVDGSREHVADADRPHRVDRAGPACRRFDGERDLGAGEERVATLRHEHSAGVTALAFNVDAQAGGRSDGGHDADVEAARLQDRSLLDVKLDECGIRIGAERDRRQRSRESRARPNIRKRAAIAVFEAVRRIRIETGGQQTAAQATDAETRWLLRREEDHFDRFVGTKT